MARQLCCRGMCKKLLRSDGQQQNYSFHRIWIAGKKSLVKRAPGYDFNSWIWNQKKNSPLPSSYSINMNITPKGTKTHVWRSDITAQIVIYFDEIAVKLDHVGNCFFISFWTLYQRMPSLSIRFFRRALIDIRFRCINDNTTFFTMFTWNNTFQQSSVDDASDSIIRKTPTDPLWGAVVWNLFCVQRWS